jgi:hypothetical protein
MSLTGLSLEMYIIHFSLRQFRCPLRSPGPSDRSSQIWALWIDSGLLMVLSASLTLKWDCDLRQIQKVVKKFQI